MVNLLQQLKNRLRITWNEDDDHLLDLLESGKAYFDDIVGAPLLYDTDFVAKDLLLERTRYVYNNASDEFLVNYADDILRLQMRVAIEARSESDAQSL